MRKLIYGLVSGGFAATLLGLVARADTILPADFTVPTSTGHDVLASASVVIKDPGLLFVAVIAAGVPLAFWALKKAIGLIRK